MQGNDFKLISAQEIDSFLSYISSDAPRTCLDLGCGTGQLTRELFHRGYRVIGVDASLEAVRRARKLTIAPSEQLAYVHADLEQDLLPDILAPAGLITCKLVYAFIKDKPTFLARVRSVLHEQGLFVVVTPMVADVAPEKKSIAANEEDVRLLEDYFAPVAHYRHKGLTYFVCRPRS